MPDQNKQPRTGYPLGRSELRKSMGRGPLRDYLDFSSRDVVHYFHDFGETTFLTNPWTVAAGATATTWAITVAENGLLRGVSGTTAATSGLQLMSPAFFFGDRNCGCEVRYKLSAITEVRTEIGFVDAAPAVNTSIVNNLSTPTFNTAAEAAIYLFDDASSVVTSGLYTDGSGAIAAAKTATTTGRPTAATFTTVRVQVIGDTVTCWVDGALLVEGSAQAIEGGTALRFVFSQKTSNTASKNIDIDYVRMWQDRN